MDSKNKTNRRRFLRKAATAAFGVTVLPSIIPASALGKDGHVPPSDRIVMGAIGVGSMGTGNMINSLKKNEVRYVAVCDVDLKRSEKARLLVNQTYKNSDCREYSDFREFLENEELDAVCIGLPDHWHAIISIAVANKGIDIYGEKPLARSIKECRAIVDAVEKNKIIWQTGSWQRSVAHFHYACELIRNGKLGEITYVEVGLPDGRESIGTPPVMPVPDGLDWDFWLGPAPARSYRGVCHWDWRWILDYSGGQLTDWAGHHVDIAHWGLGLDRSGPVEIEGKGVYPLEGIFNVPFEYDFTCKYENGLTMRVANRSRLPQGMGATWYGEKGWLNVDRSGLTAEYPEILNEKIGDGDIKLYKSIDHWQNFLDCVKSRKETITPAEIAHRSISVGLLGEIAMLTGQKLFWDLEKEMFTNSEYANRLLSWPYKKPWDLNV